MNTPFLPQIDTSDPNYETESAYVWAVLVQADSQFTVTATFTDSEWAALASLSRL